MCNSIGTGIHVFLGFMALGYAQLLYKAPQYVDNDVATSILRNVHLVCVTRLQGCHLTLRPQ